MLVAARRLITLTAAAVMFCTTAAPSGLAAEQHDATSGLKAARRSNDRPLQPERILHCRAQFRAPEHLPDDRIRCLLVVPIPSRDSQGADTEGGVRSKRRPADEVWVGTESGLVHFDGSKWTRWTMADGLPSPVVSAIDRDPLTGDLWLGTWGGGLVRFSAGRFDGFNQLNSGLAGDLVFDVKVFDGRVWAATNGGLCQFQVTADSWTVHFPRRADEAAGVVTRLAEIDDSTLAGIDVPRVDSMPARSTLLASGWGTGLLRWDKSANGFRALDVPSATRRPPAGGLLGRRTVSAQGRCTASANPLCGRRPAATPGFKGQPSASESALPAVILDVDASADALAVLTSSAVFVSRAPSWVLEPLDFSMSDGEFARSVALGADGRVWLGCSDGLRILSTDRAQAWTHVKVDSDTDDGLGEGSLPDGRGQEKRPATPATLVRCVAFLGPELWIGTNDGLFSARLEPSPDSADKRSIAELEHSRSSRTPPDSRSPLRESLSATQQGLPPPNLDPTPPVVIGVMGPRTRTIALPDEPIDTPAWPRRPDLLAAQVPVDDMNERGGFRWQGTFSIASGMGRYQRYGWVLPEDDFATFLSHEQASGVIAYLDPSQWVTSAVAWHTELPVLNVAPAAGETAHAIANPWVFRCHQDEPTQLRLLVDYLARTLRVTRVATLQSAGATLDSHIIWLAQLAARSGLTVGGQLVDPKDPSALRAQLAALAVDGTQAILSWSSARDSARWLQAIRDEGLDLLLIAGPEVVTESFAASAGSSAPRVITLHATPSSDAGGTWNEFDRAYTQRSSSTGGPNALARGTYAATDHLLAAVKLAGRNREQIRRVLHAMQRSPEGEMHYARLLDRRPPTIAELKDGRWAFRPAAGPEGGGSP